MLDLRRCRAGHGAQNPLINRNLTPAETGQPQNLCLLFADIAGLFPAGGVDGQKQGRQAPQPAAGCQGCGPDGVEIRPGTQWLGSPFRDARKPTPQESRSPLRCSGAGLSQWGQAGRKGRGMIRRSDAGAGEEALTPPASGAGSAETETVGIGLSSRLFKASFFTCLQA